MKLLVPVSFQRWFLFLLLPFFFQACTVQRQMNKKIDHFFAQSELMRGHLTGFALASSEDGRILYGKNADQYFVPASNTKLFTFYTAWKMLPDSLPAMKYIISGDSLIFWGTGDPSLLQGKLKARGALDFLKSSNKTLYFAAGRYTGSVYGEGWSWDDYNDYYQAEITELPISDNMISLQAVSGKLELSPGLFRTDLFTDSTFKPAEFIVRRDWKANRFQAPRQQVPAGYQQQIPYQTSSSLTVNLLSDVLQKPVSLVKKKLPDQAAVIFQSRKEDVLREMMLPSDNFIAEHLLLLCADSFQAELNGKDAIAHALSHELAGLPDKPKWVDGSGLSRMNLFTPRDIIKVLHLIDSAVADRDMLYSMLPSGGKTGTLKNAYPATDEPFVYGKTGTLSGVYNQSGFVKTKTGKTYLFSFMNNNFTGSAVEVRKELVRLMSYIHDHY